MKFIKHIPSFVDYREEIPTCEFESVDDLLRTPEMQAHSSRQGFSHFAISQNGSSFSVLAVSDEGFKWWVVGYTDTGDIFHLWEGWKFRALLDGKECVLGKGVVTTSCGDVPTLVDGRQAKNLRY